MFVRSSTASRCFVCLVALLVCGAGTVGAVAAAGGSALLETEDDALAESVDETTETTNETTNESEESADETTETLENTTTEATDETENTTDETTDEVDETVDQTSDELESETTETTETVQNTTDGTTDELEESVDDTADAVDETTDTVDETVDETTDTVDGTTDEVDETVDGTTDEIDETTETLENATDESIDGLENGTETTTDAVDIVANETTETLERAVDGPTVGVDVDVGDERNGTLGPGSGPIDLEVSAASDSSDDANDDSERGGASDSDDGGDGSGGLPSVPDGTSSATDAVLVGLLGTITVTGAAAGSAGAAGGAAGASASASAGAGAGAAAGSAGAAGSAAGGAAAGGAAAGGATGLAASWLNQSALLRHLRRIGSHLPWELAAILGYSRYDDSDPLENDRRRTIYETIADDPGCYLSAVSEESGVALSTVRHHVRILEEEGLIEATKVNGKRRYYLADRDAASPADEDDAAPTLKNAELHAALAEPAKRAVLEALAELESAPNGTLAEELGRDPSTVSHHLSALEEDGLVVREKDGRSVVNELAPDVEAALRSEDAALEDEGVGPSASAPADD